MRRFLFALLISLFPIAAFAQQHGAVQADAFIVNNGGTIDSTAGNTAGAGISVGGSFPKQSIGLSNSGVTAGSYTCTDLTVDVTGRITTAANGSCSGGGSLPWFNVTTYGATGNGTTDDTTAIDSAIAAMNTAGAGVLYFPAGTYKTTAALTTISANGLVIGDGGGGRNGVTNAASLITETSGTAALFTVTDSSLVFRDIALENTSGTTPTAGAGIVVTSSTADQTVSYHNVTVQGFYVDIDVQDGMFWQLTNSYIINPVLYGVRIRDLATADGGGWMISDSVFMSGTNAATDALRMESAGGGRIVNCKFVDNAGSSRFVTDIQVAGSGNTSILLVSNSSFENYSGTAIVSSGVWPYQIYSNLQFGQYGNSTGHAISISSNNDVIIDNITLVADTGTPTAIALSSCTRCTVGQLQNNGFSTLISGTPTRDNTGGVGGRVQITGTPISGYAPIADGTNAAWGPITATAAGSSGDLQYNNAGVIDGETQSAALDGIGSTQGDILYRNATGWAVLAPGTSGQYLQTQGTSANPQWATLSGGGNVTGPGSSTTGDCAKFADASGTLLADAGAPCGGSGSPGGSNHQVQINSSGSFGGLSTGTSGQVLTSGGASADPSFQDLPSTTPYLEQHMASNSAELDFTTGITDSCHVYQLVLSDFVLGTTSAALTLQFGTGATPTWDTGTNYDFLNLSFNTVATNNTVISDKTTATTSIQLVRGGIGTSGTENTNVILYNLRNGSAYKNLTSQFIEPGTSAETVGTFGGVWKSTTPASALRIQASSGNLTSGTATLTCLVQ